MFSNEGDEDNQEMRSSTLNYVDGDEGENDVVSSSFSFSWDGLMMTSHKHDWCKLSSN